MFDQKTTKSNFDSSGRRYPKNPLKFHSAVKINFFWRNDINHLPAFPFRCENIFWENAAKRKIDLFLPVAVKTTLYNNVLLCCFQK